ncbi:MAG TPA: hypothetical protein VJ650_03990 [Gemmatimonadaceae bacterium]|nr:hypothetical protein [Gemmatimonadaceae bacterium]
MRAEFGTITRAQTLMRALTAMVVVAITLAWGCADFESTVDPTGGLPDVEVANPSFANDIQPIFTARCAIGGCHSVNSARAELVLVAGHAYDSLVNKPAYLNSALDRVEPGDAANSWLVRMIGEDDAARLHYSRMPLGGRPLTDNQIATIVNWVENGALRN